MHGKWLQINSTTFYQKHFYWHAFVAYSYCFILIWFPGGVNDCIMLILNNKKKRKIKLNEKIGNIPHLPILLHAIMYISRTAYPIVITTLTNESYSGVFIK